MLGIALDNEADETMLLWAGDGEMFDVDAETLAKEYDRALLDDGATWATIWEKVDADAETLDDESTLLADDKAIEDRLADDAAEVMLALDADTACCCFGESDTNLRATVDRPRRVF
uniref:Uncharacterized protein n=1 Tax=Mycena chlorophos TaxID=658473 RepID=A0ABQ0L2I7_MYCCL|nr:predicted protein [Mycena chlorophos]